MPVIFDIKVIPRSTKTGFSLDASGILKAYLKSAPEQGKANKELIMLLAVALHCPQSFIHIMTGATTRKKRIRVELPLTYDDIINKLGFAVQLKLIR